MHCVILGGGALGSILAAHLLQAGHQVALVARGQRALALRENGLQIRGLTELNLPCEVVTDPATLAATDLFINTVKTFDTHAALQPLSGLRPRLACSVQNGVMKEDALTVAFDPACVLGAMADFSGELCDDGTVLFTRNVCLHLGELQGGESARVAAVAAALDAAGIVTRQSPAINEVIWSKYVGWVALMLMAVLTRQGTAAYLADPDSARVVARITREMGALAAARGIALRDQSPVPARSILAGSEDEAVAIVRELGATFARTAPGHRMSSLQDVERSRALEVEETAGYGLRLGRELGLTMPTLELCYRLAISVHRAHLAAG